MHPLVDFLGDHVLDLDVVHDDGGVLESGLDNELLPDHLIQELPLEPDPLIRSPSGTSTPWDCSWNILSWIWERTMTESPTTAAIRSTRLRSWAWPEGPEAAPLLPGPVSPKEQELSHDPGWI